MEITGTYNRSNHKWNSKESKCLWMLSKLLSSACAQPRCLSSARVPNTFHVPRSIDLRRRGEGLTESAIKFSSRLAVCSDVTPKIGEYKINKIRVVESGNLSTQTSFILGRKWWDRCIEHVQGHQTNRFVLKKKWFQISFDKKIIWIESLSTMSCAIII